MTPFGKKEEKPFTPPPQPRREEETVVPRNGELNALLGKGSEFEGKLAFEGQVRIDGKFTGQITTKDTLVIGDGAKVMAEIQAGTVIVNGVVEGNIKATQSIELHQPGRIKGNIETPSLLIDKGVVFEGSCKMEGGPGIKSVSTSPPLQVAAAAKS